MHSKGVASVVPPIKDIMRSTQEGQRRTQQMVATGHAIVTELPVAA